MEKTIPPSKMSEELTFIKRQIEVLSNQKLKYDNNFSIPPSKKSRKATIAHINLSPPPKITKTNSATDLTSTANSNSITLLLKSTKPSLSYTLLASPTETILNLKQQLCKENSDAPPPDAQRWVKGGKAMTDNKLLKEFEGLDSDKEGVKIFLMVKAGWVSNPTPVKEIKEIPTIQLEPPTSTPTKPTLIIDTTESLAEKEEIPPFVKSLSDPLLWKEAHALLLKKLGNEEEVRKVWEAWFGSCKVWLEPTMVANVRDKVGITAMAGT